MKVLQIIHGFPPYYMAGSEVYTYNLSIELSKYIPVHVFTRIENPFEPSYYSSDNLEDNINVRRVNKPERDYVLKDKYLDPALDKVFREYLQVIRPDIVHIGHLSHLSTNIVDIVKKEFGLPIVFTIHDYWLYCLIGQLITPENELCHGPSIGRCLKCAQRKFKDTCNEEDIRVYRQHMERVIDSIDLFLAPSQFVLSFFKRMGVPEDKLKYSKYGFNKNHVAFRKRIYANDSHVQFGYTGRVIPVKGIHILINAFRQISSDQTGLSIYGNTNGYDRHLKSNVDDRIVFHGGYNNNEIDAILRNIDVLVCPSIWYENSPLVIQEAFLAGIPVITSDIGGMSELVQNAKNGFTFKTASVDSLRDIMAKIVKEPTILNTLHPNPDSVRSIEDDAKGILDFYRELIM